MSLINDALRDLEERKDTGSDDNLSHADSCSHNHLNPTKETSFRKWVVFVGASVMTGALAMSFVDFNVRDSLVVDANSSSARDYVDASAGLVSKGVQGEGASVEQSAKSQNDSPEESQALTMETQAAKSQENSVESFVDENATNSSERTESNLQPTVLVHEPASDEKNLEEVVTLWLGKAEKNYQQNRLSVPANNNALFFIKKILEVSPENGAALALKENIKNRYRSLIQAAIDHGDSEKVSRLLSRYVQLGIAPSEYAFYVKSLEGMELQDNSVVAVHEREDSAKNIVINDANKDVSPAIDTVQQIPQDKPSNNTRWVSESHHSKINSSLKAAKNAVGTYEAVSAVRQLEQSLGLDNGERISKEILLQRASVDAFAFLIDFYAGERNMNSLTHIQNAVSAQDALSRYSRAKQALLVNDIVGAYEVLKATGSTQSFEAYEALLAALHHKMNEFVSARDLYRKLLVNDINNPQYLLGYALALDALEDKDRAYSAYQDLVRVKHPNAAVMKYSQERLESLAQGRSLEASVW